MIPDMIQVPITVLPLLAALLPAPALQCAPHQRWPRIRAGLLQAVQS